MTVGTLHNDKKKPPLDLLILDECHHATAQSWAICIDHYRSKHGAKILGASATPKRGDGKPFDELSFKSGNRESVTIPGFSVLIPGPQVVDLIKAGHLVPVEVFASKYIVDSDGFKKRKGEYDQGDIDSAMAKIQPEDVYREWLSVIGADKLTVVYPSSVAYSEDLHQYFNEQMPGISAHIDSETPASVRRQILTDFAMGKIKVLFQHSIIIEGVDIQMLRL